MWREESALYLCDCKMSNISGDDKSHSKDVNCHRQFNMSGSSSRCFLQYIHRTILRAQAVAFYVIWPPLPRGSRYKCRIERNCQAQAYLTLLMNADHLRRTSNTSQFYGTCRREAVCIAGGGNIGAGQRRNLDVPSIGPEPDRSTAELNAFGAGASLII